MKIAIVFDGLQIGGIERVGADYARILSELGHDVTVVNLVPNLKEMEKEFPKDCKYEKRTWENRLDDNTGAFGNRDCIMCSILFCAGTVECCTEPDSFFLW